MLTPSERDDAYDELAADAAADAYFQGLAEEQVLDIARVQLEQAFAVAEPERPAFDVRSEIDVLVTPGVVERAADSLNARGAGRWEHDEDGASLVFDDDEVMEAVYAAMAPPLIRVGVPKHASVPPRRRARCSGRTRGSRRRPSSNRSRAPTSDDPSDSSELAAPSNGRGWRD